MKRMLVVATAFLVAGLFSCGDGSGPSDENSSSGTASSSSQELNSSQEESSSTESSSSKTQNSSSREISSSTESSSSETQNSSSGESSSSAESSSSEAQSSSSQEASSSSQAEGRKCTYEVTDSPIAGAGTLTCSEKTYKTVTMGTQVWMAENLNFGDRVSVSVEQFDATNASAEKYCYDNLEENCTTYGGLYQWHSEMAFPLSCDTILDAETYADSCTVQSPHHRGICPEGWHVPSRIEWVILQAWVDDDNGGGAGDEGKSLWSTDQGGTDAYKWNALPGGNCFSKGTFHNIGMSAAWWSSTGYNTVDAWNRSLSGSTLYENNSYKGINGFSLRCVKD